MRIYLKLSANKKPVDFSYQEKLVGAFHKWVGINPHHDEISLYSLSWLNKAKIKKRTLDFPDGANWFISAWDGNILKRAIEGIKKNPEIAYGFEVIEITLTEIPDFSGITKFPVASPVFIKELL